MRTKNRQHPRTELNFRVDYVDRQGRADMGLARNLSYSGVYLVYTSKLRVGELLTMTFVLPTGKACKLHGQVVRTDSGGAGLCFVSDVKTHLDFGTVIH